SDVRSTHTHSATAGGWCLPPSLSKPTTRNLSANRRTTGEPIRPLLPVTMMVSGIDSSPPARRDGAGNRSSMFHPFHPTFALLVYALLAFVFHVHVFHVAHVHPGHATPTGPQPTFGVDQEVGRRCHALARLQPFQNLEAVAKPERTDLDCHRHEA